ncbi:MAG: hypothetical protein ABI361_03535 [Nitrososphaera sp.]|jgi:hypothetical protein
MSQNNDPIIYLKYKNLGDMLKVMIYSSQSMLGVIPNLYYISHGGRHILFLMTGAIGGVTAHYVVEKEMPTKKYIQLKRLTGEYSFLDGMGTDSLSLYVPILILEKSTLDFPV